MAKADDTSSTIDWIWLREALALAVAALGSVELAKERLIEWLAAGKLPWSCMSWKGHNAEEIAKAKQQLREGEIIHIFPSAAYHEGDPKFWGVAVVQIDWEDNTACEPVTGGAKALGIKVSRTHLLALLPEEPRERVETPGQAKAAEREKMGPKDWLAWARNEYRQQRNERPNAYISRLHDLMEKTGNVTVVWTFKTFRVRYYEAVKADQQTVQKAR